jgi:pimeloyl-ACP methyl ester carboxylesterase
MVKRLQADHDIHQGEGYWETHIRQMAFSAWALLIYPLKDLRKIVDPVLPLIGDRDEFYPIVENVHVYRTVPGAEVAAAPVSDHLSRINNAELFTSLAMDPLLLSEVHYPA